MTPALWSDSDALMPIVAAFGGGRGSAMPRTAQGFLTINILSKPALKQNKDFITGIAKSIALLTLKKLYAL